MALYQVNLSHLETEMTKSITVLAINNEAAHRKAEIEHYEILSIREIGPSKPQTYLLTKITACVMVFLGIGGFIFAPLAGALQPLWLCSILMLGFGLLLGLTIDIARYLRCLVEKS